MYLYRLTLGAAMMIVASHTATAETPSYLYEAVKADTHMASEFKRIIEPLNAHFPWVANYGTTSPAESATIEQTNYTVYQGCKPHACPSQRYVLLYNEQTKKMVAGAFVQNKYQDGQLQESKVSWLGARAADFAPAIGQYLF